MIGLHKEEVPFDFWTVLHRKIEVRASLGCEDDDVYDVMNAIKKKDIKTKSLISDIISLSDIHEKGFKRLLSPNDMVKILVRP